MKEHIQEFVAGIFVLAGLAVITYLAVSLGGATLLGSDTYTLTARFTNVSGVQEGTPIKVAGVRVGKVTAIELDTEKFYALVTLQLQGNLSFDDDTIAAVRTNGLIGDRFIALLPGGSGFPLEPGDLIVDTESAVDIENLISRFAFGDVDNGE